MLLAKNLKTKTKHALGLLEEERLKRLNDERLARLELARKKRESMRLKLRSDREKERQAKRLEKRIIEEKEKTKRKRLEQARVEKQKNLNQKRERTLITKIYQRLLGAAIAGERQIVLDVNTDIDCLNLGSYGLSIFKPKKEEAFLNKCHLAIKNHLKSAASSRHWSDCISKRSLDKIWTNIDDAGFLAASENLLQFLRKCYLEIDSGLGKLKAREQACSVEKIDQNLSNQIARLMELRNERKIIDQKEIALQNFANKNSQKIEKISREHNIWSSTRTRESVNYKVKHLRDLFKEHLSELDCKTLTDVNLINIVRYSHGAEGMSAKSLQRESGISGQIFDSPRHEKICAGVLAEIEKTKRNRKAVIDISISLELEIQATAKTLFHLQSLINRISEILESVAEELNEGAKTNFIYSNSAYRAITHFSLNEGGKQLDPLISKAYREIIWLLSNEGKAFLEYMQIVFERLAESAYDSADLIVKKLDSDVKLFLGGVSLVAAIRVELLLLILFLSGFKLSKIRSDRDEERYLVRW